MDNRASVATTLLRSDPRSVKAAYLSRVRGDSGGKRLLVGSSTAAAAAFVGGLALLLSAPWFKALQADSYRLLYDGRFIAHVAIPHHDVFTLAARGGAFVDQQWLAELLDYGVWLATGYAGLAVFSALAFVSGYALLVGLLRRVGASLVLALVCALFAMLSALSLVFIRAQVFAIPLFVAVLWLCVEDSRQERPRAALLLVLPTLALWANLHGSVLVGTAVAAAYFLWRSARTLRRREPRPAARYAALAVGASLMPLATPYGVHVLTYYKAMMGNSAVGLADIEWDHPIFPSLGFFQFVIPLAATFASLLIARARGYRPPVLAVVALFITAAAAALAMRNNVWLGIAAAVLLASSMQSWVPTAKPTVRFRRTLASLAVLLAVIGVTRIVAASRSGFDALISRRAIERTAAYVESHPCSTVIGDNVSASALLWLDPKASGHLVFAGELEIYSQSALRRWVAYQRATAPGWAATTMSNDLLLGSAVDHPVLARRLARLRGGTVLARDDRGIVVVRDSRARRTGCAGSAPTRASAAGA